MPYKHVGSGKNPQMDREEKTFVCAFGIALGWLSDLHTVARVRRIRICMANAGHVSLK